MIAVASAPARRIARTRGDSSRIGVSPGFSTDKGTRKVAPGCTRGPLLVALRVLGVLAAEAALLPALRKTLLPALRKPSVLDHAAEATLPIAVTP